MNAILPQITFRDISPSEAVRARIVERAAQLARFHSRIMSCHVVVRGPHRHSRKGRPYSIRIDVKVPGREIVINRHPTPRLEHSDIYVAVRDAFEALERRLEDTARRRRGEIKAHSKGGVLKTAAAI